MLYPARIDGRHRVEVGLADRRGGVGECRRRGGNRARERGVLVRRDPAIDVVCRRRTGGCGPGQLRRTVDVARCLRVVDCRDGKSRRGICGGRRAGGDERRSRRGDRYQSGPHVGVDAFVIHVVLLFGSWFAPQRRDLAQGPSRLDGIIIPQP